MQVKVKVRTLALYLLHPKTGIELPNWLTSEVDSPGPRPQNAGTVHSADELALGSLPPHRMCIPAPAPPLCSAVSLYERTAQRQLGCSTLNH